MTKLGLYKCIVEHGVYVKGWSGTSDTIICLYVDDLLIIGRDSTEIGRVKNRLKEEFEMTDLGELSYFSWHGILYNHARRYRTWV